jgi:predicted polyphosphate/ATP-dependent NAD kinase
MGGRVGLKGTDGGSWIEALRLGAEEVSPARAVEALMSLKETSVDFRILTCPGKMGEEEVRQVGLSSQILEGIRADHTTGRDTARAAKEMESRHVKLLLFVGGDGTARDVCSAIDARLPVVGIPAGVKMYSAVFAVTPRLGGLLASRFLTNEIATKEAEVMDVDEEAFKRNVLRVRLYGYMKTPDDKVFMQSSKASTGLLWDESEEQDAIAQMVVEVMDPDYCYILGPGSTTAAIARRLGLEKTLLGVDVISKERLIARDVNESELLSILKAKARKVKLIISPVGGQGYIFGRGNQQISPCIIRLVGKENIMIIGTKRKLYSLEPRRLLVDTGDQDLDRELSGYFKVISGYRQFSVMKVE